MNRDEIFSASLLYFLAPIRDLLEDAEVTEIMVNGPGEVFVERSGRLFSTDRSFSSDDSLRSAVHNIAQYVGREINADQPILDARLPDGSRVHVVMPPSSRRGVCLTIRKFRRDTMTLADFVRLGSLSETAAEFLEIAVRRRKNILVAGGTGRARRRFSMRCRSRFRPRSGSS
jgi:pilus assembly protein CpaF